MAKVLVALGGNALGNTPNEQKDAVKIAAKAIAELAREGHQIAICHGNGPQVGMINNAFEAQYKNKDVSFMMPFPECGAMSQGYIGYHLQNAIKESLKENSLNNNVITVITQTLVDKNDPSFEKPSKPIGSFMDENTAKKLASENNFNVVEDAGRGWRRVIASPKPIDIIEKDVIEKLFSSGVITVAGGGGGIPVYSNQNSLTGIDAVVDKDFTSAKLAEILNVDYFIVLTSVNKIKINFGKPNEKNIDNVDLEELQQYIDENQFAPGSMLPKVLAVKGFVERSGKPGFIGELKDAQEIIAGSNGTKIYKKV